jgi:phosphopantetheine adenylyltransferase
MSYDMELCPSGKPRYQNRPKASSAATKVNTRRRKQGLVHLRIYKCRLCKDWHLTSQSAADSREFRTRM